MKLTNLFGKQVYSLYEGEVVGTISDAYFNKNLTKISAFKIFDNEENEFLLTISNIKAFKDCIVITNKNKLEIFVNSEISPLFKEVIDENANFCGLIIDAELNNNDGNILNFVTDKNINLNPENIYLRKNFIYYSKINVLMQNYKPKAHKIESLTEINVKILTENNKLNFLPQKVQYNPQLLLGKQAKNDLLGINKEIIIKANQIITQKTIDDATKHNRINQLYFLAI